MNLQICIQLIKYAQDQGEVNTKCIIFYKPLIYLHTLKGRVHPT